MATDASLAECKNAELIGLAGDNGTDDGSVLESVNSIQNHRKFSPEPSMFHFLQLFLTSSLSELRNRKAFHLVLTSGTGGEGPNMQETNIDRLKRDKNPRETKRWQSRA